MGLATLSSSRVGSILILLLLLLLHNNNNNNEEDKDMNNKMGKLNERLMWKEEDTYEAQMRLATASFLAATTVAVGQPALALDFVLVDPSGAFRFVSLKYLIQ